MSHPYLYASAIAANAGRRTYQGEKAATDTAECNAVEATKFDLPVDVGQQAIDGIAKSVLTGV